MFLLRCINFQKLLISKKNITTSSVKWRPLMMKIFWKKFTKYIISELGPLLLSDSKLKIWKYATTNVAFKVLLKPFLNFRAILFIFSPNLKTYKLHKKYLKQTFQALKNMRSCLMLKICIFLFNKNNGKHSWVCFYPLQ